MDSGSGVFGTPRRGSGFLGAAEVGKPKGGLISKWNLDYFWMGVCSTKSADSSGYCPHRCGVWDSPWRHARSL